MVCGTQGASRRVGAAQDPSTALRAKGIPGHAAPSRLSSLRPQSSQGTETGGFPPGPKRLAPLGRSERSCCGKPGPLSISTPAVQRGNYRPDNWQASCSSGPSPSSFSHKSERHIQPPALAGHRCREVWSFSWLTSPRCAHRHEIRDGHTRGRVPDTSPASSLPRLLQLNLKAARGWQASCRHSWSL